MVHGSGSVGLERAGDPGARYVTSDTAAVGGTLCVAIAVPSSLADSMSGPACGAT